jgi:hypothetical protein
MAELEILRAEHGDCLLLHHDGMLVLIDGGPTGVYDAALKPRLEQLMAERGEPLPLRMIMVSHIDDDHIVGLADMFAEADERESEHRGPRRWRASELWFNAFGALTGAGAGGAGAGGAAQGAALNALAAAAPGSESVAIGVGVKNGNALLRDATALGIDLNTSAGGGLVEAAEAGATVVDIAPGLSFTVLAPVAKRLASLKKAWEKWEREHPTADAETAANLDRSVFNLSSIVVLADAGGKTLLLTGDARSDDVLDGLERAGLQAKGGPPLEVDVLKLPHHGSVRNVSDEFFARVRARHYVASGNGRDNNPDDAALGLLCDSRLGDAEPWTLWLTYGGAPGDGKPGLHERLKAFLDSRAAAGQQIDVRFGAAGQTQTIALD